MHAPLNDTRKAARLVVAAAAAAAAGALLAGASTASAVPPWSAPVTPAYGGSHQTATHKALVVRFFDQLFNRGNLAVVDRLVRADYVEHNPSRATGAQALRDWVADLKATYPESHVVIKRVIAEGDLVILHSNFVREPGTKGTAAFDILRIDNGKIAEHWDVSQQVPDSTASGNDMFSTISTPRLPGPDPRASSAASKKVADAAFKALTADHDVTAYDRYFADFYYQHNPTASNGTVAAKAVFTQLFADYPDLSASVKRIVAEGDYVALHSNFKMTAEGPGLAVVDLFRVRSGKIVEHWDVLQPVPGTSANDNTMF